MVSGLSVVDTSVSTSRVSVGLSRTLQSDSYYLMTLKPGIKSNKGVSIGKLPSGLNYSYNFSTGNSICLIDSVRVTPSTWLFSSAGETKYLLAEALSSGQTIQKLPGIYDWIFTWQPTQNDYVTLNLSSNSSQTVVTAKNRNGSLDVRALAQLIDNTITSVTGTVSSGASRITVYLCENSWPPKQVGATVTFPYIDMAGNRSGYDINTNAFNATAIQGANTGVGDGYFNFSTYYCADNGNTGTADDLPYLKPVVQYQSSQLNVLRGTCVGTGLTCTIDADCGAGGSCMITAPLKRFCSPIVIILMR